MRVPCPTRRSNQSILMEINREYSLEGQMLKLKLHYSGYLIRRANSLEKTLMLENIEGRRRREWQRVRWFRGVIDSMHIHLSKLHDITRDRGTWYSTVHGTVESDMI